MKPAGSLSQLWLTCRIALWLLLASVLLGASAPTEYEVKLVYLYNFTKFVTWPDSAFESPESPVNICVLGFREKADWQQLLVGKKMKTHPIVLKLLDAPPSDTACHILFITGNYDKSRTQQAINQTTAPTLLVGESPDFARYQGVIGFNTDDRRRIRIEVNLTNAKQNQLTIRAQLLEIAKVIYRDGESL